MKRRKIEKESDVMNRNETGNSSDVNNKLTLYERNRILFILQSVTLGISYSIIWPTLWIYIEKEFNLNPSTTKLLYGIVFVAYPLGSMISAQIMEKISVDTELILIILNLAEIGGNLIYSFNFHPLLPLFGRFIAGFGDSFYMIIMRDIQSKESAKSKEASGECLVAFVAGLVLAQIFNAIAAEIPFQIGAWKVNSSNYPGLIASIIFIIQSLVMRLNLSFDESEDHITSNCSNDLIKVCRYVGLKSIYINGLSFLQTYVITLLEILVPMVIFEKFNAPVLSAVFLYGFLTILYAMILMLAFTIRSDFMLELFINISIGLKMTALFCLICLISLDTLTIPSIVALIVVLVIIAVMWSNDDVMYHYLNATIISLQLQEHANAARKVTAKVAYITAGFTAPFCYTPKFVYIGVTLICLLALMMIIFVLIRIFDRSRN